MSTIPAVHNDYIFTIEINHKLVIGALIALMVLTVIVLSIRKK
jgi:hypothetical protein